MRLFVALNLPEDERARLHGATAPLREAGMPVRWVRAESIHLTLKFLGEVRPEDVEGVAVAIDAVARKSPVFDVTLGGFGAFPTLRRPQILWLGVEATPELRCLKHDVEWELAKLGFEREVRAFVPHLTLGRAAGQPGAGDFRALQPLLSEVDYTGRLHVETVDLMRSHLSPSGPRYESIRRLQLGQETGRMAGGAAPGPASDG